MGRKMGKRQENMLAKIAAITGKDLSTIKEAAAPLYSQEATILEKQSILNFFSARIRPEKRAKETDKEFEERYNEWRFTECKHCLREFSYAYSYEGVAYCSLECIDASLREIGMELTPNRDPKKRWGNHHPAIVSASALEALRDAYPNSEGAYDVPFQTVLPKSQEVSQHSELV